MQFGIYNSAAFLTASGVAVSPLATIEVRRQVDNALASIFADPDGATPITQPGFAADSLGRFQFFAIGLEDGYKVIVTKAGGGETQTLEYQPVGTAQYRDAGATGAEVMAADTPAEARAAMELGDFTSYDASPYALLSMIHADLRTTRRDLVRAGFLPAFFNQQWGGAPMPFELLNGPDGVVHEFDALSCYIDASQATSITNVTGATWTAQGFKVGKAVTLTAVWVKLHKNGNPANSLELRILPDDGTGTKPTGSTPITNGTATAQSGKLHSSEIFGQWVRFAFPTPPSLTGGTQYHITLKSSGAVDASNYWLWASNASGKYPHGNQSFGDGTPTWTANTALDCLFLIEGATSDNVIQSGGIFGDGKIQFFEGPPGSSQLNQSGAYCRAVRDIAGFDPRAGFTLILRGTAWTKGQAIWEMLYGVDHDRIAVNCVGGSGFAQVDVWEKDGTRHTVTATSVDVSSGDHDIAIYVRAANDGSDRIDLFVDGGANGTAITSASIELDSQFKLLATEWLGGGFRAATWTQKLSMTLLPSADSPAWTYTQNAGTEAAKFAVSGGRLYQNKNGYGSTETGYYVKSAAGFSNPNGWAVIAKCRVAESASTKTSSCAKLTVHDGTKQHWTMLQEYYAEQYDTIVGSRALPQLDLKRAENVVMFTGINSDVYTFINGRMIYEGTAKMTGTTASNQVEFGDDNATAGENADVIWDYVAYMNTAPFYPVVTNGALSEYALWSGDRKISLPILYNGGTELSVKQYSGLSVNVGGQELIHEFRVNGITNSPSTTAAASAMVAAPEMEVFVIGSQIKASGASHVRNSAAGGQVPYALFTDAQQIMDPPGINTGFPMSQSDAGGHVTVVSNVGQAVVPFGLHKQEVRWHGDGATGTMMNKSRRMLVEVKA